MRRGEIWNANLEPVRGSEANKVRPVVLVSNDVANDTVGRLCRGVVSVVPLSSNVEKVFAFQVLVRGADVGLPCDSKAQAEQVRSIDQTRLTEFIGTLPAATLAELDDALRLHLAL
jgi:mRNA interferase MazF